MTRETYLDSIRRGLHEAMSADERVFLLGEDLLDPYGGAFKVSKGLSTSFPGRVISTPISEAAITGVATGMALRGLRPVVEIMFGDFLTLCADQLVNSASKFPLMYPNQIRVPLVMRTPMGGGRGYGPTHSQSIEKMFLGVPGLAVVSPSLAHNPGALLRSAISGSEQPLLFVEYKTLYPKRLVDGSDGLHVREVQGDPPYSLVKVENYSGAEPDVVVIAYGGASEFLFDAMRSLIPEEIKVQGLLPSRLDAVQETPWWFSELTGKAPIVVAECGTQGFNWGGEIAALIHREFFRELVSPVVRVSSDDGIVPASREMEKKTLLSTDRLINSIMGCLA